MTNDHLVSVRGLSKVFGGRHGQVRAVDGVDLNLVRGQTMALVGESGSGKTTLSRCILHLLDWTSGTIEIDGARPKDMGARELRRFRGVMQMVFQDPFASLNPRMRIGEILEEPLLLHGTDSKQTRRAMVRAVLEQVQLDPAYAPRFPGELSGGEQQRVAIGRAIITNPKLVVLDEPTAALDALIRKGLYELLVDLQETLGLTYLLVSHDLASVWAVSDSVAVMYRGRIVEIGSRESVFLNPSHPYTVALMSAAPQIGRRFDPRRDTFALKLDESSGQLAGCAFEHRCPFAIRECTTREPGLQPVGVPVEGAPAHYAACLRSDHISVELAGHRVAWDESSVRESFDPSPTS
jgi:oligopeptide transport system ATP-binding protein